MNELLHLQWPVRPLNGRNTTFTCIGQLGARKCQSSSYFSDNILKFLYDSMIVLDTLLFYSEDILVPRTAILKLPSALLNHTIQDTYTSLRSQRPRKVVPMNFTLLLPTSILTQDEECRHSSVTQHEASHRQNLKLCHDSYKLIICMSLQIHLYLYYQMFCFFTLWAIYSFLLGDPPPNTKIIHNWACFLPSFLKLS